MDTPPVPSKAAAVAQPAWWQSWELILRAHRVAMKARFSVLAAALFTVLLLTGPGQDIVRSVATGPYDGTAPPSSAPPVPDFPLLAWFAVGIFVLGLACWASARLVLAVRFGGTEDSGNGSASDRAEVEDRLRRDLPIYYGAAPFVAAACSFAVAPLRETSASPATAQLFAAAFAPLLLFFLLPLLLVVIRAKNTKPKDPSAKSGPAESTRDKFGPLSWTLALYTGLAVLHAVLNWGELQLLGWVPVVLLFTALFVFGKDRRSALYLVPAALLAGALWTWAWHWEQGKKDAPLFALPCALLFALAFVAVRTQRKRRGEDVEADDVHIPIFLHPTTILRLLYDRNAIATALENQPEAAQVARRNVPALRGLLWLGAIFILIHVILLFALLGAPQALPRWVGSGATLAFGLAAVASIGGALLFVTQASRFPVLFAAAAFTVLCSGLMDNHRVRLMPHTPPEVGVARESQGPDPIGAAFQLWHRDVAEPQHPHSEAPCIIVATEGGGIRAAFWTAAVLATLQDLSLERAAKTGRPDFASHVFAISGVSGGSVGAALFVALCAEDRKSGDMQGLAARIAGRDHLAPTLGALLYPDLLQRFLPWECLPDRAKSFEESWETAWAQTFPKSGNRMAQGFLELWRTPSPDEAPRPWLPALFLNATLVERGKRTIASNLPIRTGAGGQFIDAHDLHAHLRTQGVSAGDWRDLPLITAAHASARFPLVSPPGRLPSGARVVDGGYFENSGAATGLDVLNAVRRTRDAQHLQTPFIFLFLRYGSGPALTQIPKLPGNGGSLPVPASDATCHPAKNFFNETGSIAGTVLATRDARGSYAADAIFHGFADGAHELIVLSCTFSGESIPLSWSLSRRSCVKMLEQLPKDLAPRAEHTPTTRANLDVAKEILGLLYGP